MDAAAYTALLAPVFAGRKVVLEGELATQFSGTASLVHAMGAEVMIVGLGGRGVGSLPEPDIARVEVFDLPSTASSMELIRATEKAIREPSPEVLRVVREFDPERRAFALGTFLNIADSIDGRPFLAYRRPEWLALEDKTVIDAFWDRAGIERSVSRVVPVNSDALRRASNEIEEGHGTVWSGDAREGFNGGAEYVRWIRTADEVNDALRFFEPRCSTVRVMPFLEGVPCSIHGIVFPNHVAVLRPVEMVTLRRVERSVDDGAFCYCGCATFYDPPASIRDEMRAVATRVGEQLRNEVDFRGAFTVDGVATSNGFLPTELNPRMGAGLNTVLRGSPALPVQLLLDALVGDIELDYDPVVFERQLLAVADATRAGGTWRGAPGRSVSAVDERGVVFEDGTWRWAHDGEPCDGLVSAGTRSGNGFVRVTFDPARTPIGESVGQCAAAFWAFADQELGTGFGPMLPAIAQI